jgi:uncharacterized membrane protein
MVRMLSWRSISMAAAVAGVVVATYLTIIHYDRSALVCGLGDCQTVQNSEYAVVAGVPIALLGLLMYLSVIGIGIARHRLSAWESQLTVTAFTLVLAGALYAAYLTYLEVAVIRTICEWCVTSALLTVGILIAEGIGLSRILLRSPAE